MSYWYHTGLFSHLMSTLVGILDPQYAACTHHDPVCCSRPSRGSLGKLLISCPLRIGDWIGLNKPSIYIQQKISFVNLGVCPMQLFHFWSRDVHPVQNLLLCTKFHENPMIFHWDMDISNFKMAATWHLQIVLPPYETTHKVSVTGRSCLSNFISMWYKDLKI